MQGPDTIKCFSRCKKRFISRPTFTLDTCSRVHYIAGKGDFLAGKAHFPDDHRAKVEATPENREKPVFELILVGFPHQGPADRLIDPNGVCVARTLFFRPGYDDLVADIFVYLAG